MNQSADEKQRLSALDSYDVLDTPPEETFDRITRMARLMFNVPMSTITFIDGHRQWFKSRQGVVPNETDRAPALCDVAMREDRPLIIPDTWADARFQQNAFVVGEPHIRFYAGAPIRTPEGQNIGTVCAMDTKPRTFEPEQVAALADLAKIVVDELILRRLANTDSLTGARSRRAFREEGGRALALALRHGHPLSCAMFDLDHFKRINDANGHEAGDAVLLETIAVCRTKLRMTDLVGRMGGEEFAILMPHTNSVAAMRVAEKVRSAIARLKVPVPSGLVDVSASFGVATVDREVVDFDELLRRADAALYAAKADGRNRSAAWQQPKEMPEAGLRRRVLKAGHITFNSGRSTIDCTVRSLSNAGAGIDLLSTAGVPDQFKLRIDSDDLSRVCHIRAKRDKHIDVDFES